MLGGWIALAVEVAAMTFRSTTDRRQPIPLLVACCAALLVTATLAPSRAEAGGRAASNAAVVTDPMSELVAMETRVAPIIHRLVTGSARWCPKLMPVSGWLLGDQRLYSAQIWPRAKAAYGVGDGDGDGPFIAALAPQSPGGLAGLRVGDVVTAVNGISIEASPPSGIKGEAHARMAAAHALLAQQNTDAPLLVSIARLDEPITIKPHVGCASEFRVEASDRVGAQADGTIVFIPAGMIRFARAEDELATVIAHELAHNILRHRERLNAANIQRGLAQQFGRNARLTRITEIEADRLSVWLLAGAGYNPAAAVRFWTDFGKRRGGGIFQSATHPRWRERVRIVMEETRMMQALLAADPRATPPLLTNMTPLDLE